MPWLELGKAILTASIAGGLSLQVAKMIPLRGSRGADLKSLGLVSVTWAGAVAAGLWILHSELPHLMRRRRTVPPETSVRSAHEAGNVMEP